MENGYAGRSYRKGFEFMTDDIVDIIAREAVDKTAILFKAVKPKGGEMPVVMGAGGSGILLHEAIGHAFEADFNRKRTSIFCDLLGKKVCDEHINCLLYTSQYQHFVFGLHVPEVTNGSHHACGIGIIGIDNQSVVRCFFQL